ncbi:zinc carboxypeptidase [Lewinellaceae bacterium SD302]|nr:zinc carboxypeptidase [Lewinellaceae bacterium SD302]
MRSSFPLISLLGYFYAAFTRQPKPNLFTKIFATPSDLASSRAGLLVQKKLSLIVLLVLGLVSHDISTQGTPPAPGDILPHQLGETFTPHHLLVDYFEAVAEVSERVQLTEYGRTNEDRPLLLAFVSTPENLAKLEDIRLNNLRRTGLVAGDTDPNLDLSIVWLSYSVHGNEAGGSEASMGVLYDLADPNNARTSEWLKNTLVIIDPSLNPDGFNRYSNWYRQIATTELSPGLNVREHREPWPGGRVNHYLFDLNRDWAWQTQVESRQRMKVYQEWMPHVHADVHEQGHTSPYYFAPAAKPFHDYITDWQEEFQTEIGKNHARYFDREGWLYFTRESFDLFYPSYGDTYPTFNGAIGMTYEQAGHGRSGRAIDLPTGDTLTLSDRIAHHRTTSLSTVETASKENDRMVEEFGKYWKNSGQNAPGKYKTYVISGNNPRGKLRALTELLDRNGIRYHRATKRGSYDLFSYSDGKMMKSGTQAGDLVISVNQPKGLLTQVLFDPDARLEDSVTYDITAWSLPQAYGLETYASESSLNLGVEAYNFPTWNNPLDGIDANSIYSYVLPWEDLSSARFLAAAIQAGLQVRTSGAAGQFGERKFPAGSVVINKGDNRKTADFANTVARLVAEHEVDILPITTGFSTSGFDFGSSNYNLQGRPRVATLAGQQVRANEFGQIWYYFEQDLGYPISIYNFDDLGRLANDDVDVLILPEGYFNFSESQLSSLRDWVRGGGKLIAIGSATRALAGAEGFGLKYKESPEEESDPLQDYGGAERRFISSYVPGAIVSTELDDTHPLSYGLGDRYASLKTNSLAYQYLKDGVNAGRLREGAYTSGFMGHRARKQLAESLSFGVESMGSGTVIYLVDNPLFRGFWHNGKVLMANALFQVD